MTAGDRSELRSVVFGGETIPFELKRGRGSRLRIAVHPDLRVVVHAPAHATTAAIESRVRRRGAWILKHLARFKDLPPRSQKHYVSGESVLYLGRQYRLKVVESSSRSVKLRGRFLWVTAADKADTNGVKRAVRGWYRVHARRVFERRLEVCHAAASRHGIARPEVRIRWMKTRWGSTPGSSNILLNTQLVKTPTYCIDYVIMHELCHLNHPHHGKEFYELLSRCMPDWRARKERLELAEL